MRKTLLNRRVEEYKAPICNIYNPPNDKKKICNKFLNVLILNILVISDFAIFIPLFFYQKLLHWLNLHICEMQF